MVVNPYFDNSDQVADNVSNLVKTYHASKEWNDARGAIQAAFADSLSEQLPSPPKAPEPTRGMFQQFGILTERFLKTLGRSRNYFWNRLLAFTLMNLLLGFVFFRMSHMWEDTWRRVSLLFLILALNSFNSVPALPTQVADMKARGGACGNNQITPPSPHSSLLLLPPTTTCCPCCCCRRRRGGGSSSLHRSTLFNSSFPRFSYRLPHPSFLRNSSSPASAAPACTTPYPSSSPRR